VEAVLSGAGLTLQALEEIRHAALLRLTALDSERPKVAYAAVADNSVIAKQRWNALDSEAEHLIERIRLFDAAIYEARERASHPDWKTQWRQITKTEMST
jgi:hypothetical protein